MQWLCLLGANVHQVLFAKTILFKGPCDRINLFPFVQYYFPVSVIIIHS